MILHDQITVQRAPLVAGPYGNQSRNWASPSATDYLVHWSGQAVTEVLGDEAKTVTRVKILGNPDLDLEATDRVVGPDGNTYEVDGQVMLSYRLGQLHHVRAFLRRITEGG